MDRKQCRKMKLWLGAAENYRSGSATGTPAESVPLPNVWSVECRPWADADAAKSSGQQGCRVCRIRCRSSSVIRRSANSNIAVRTSRSAAAVSPQTPAAHVQSPRIEHGAGLAMSEGGRKRAGG